MLFSHITGGWVEISKDKELSNNFIVVSCPYICNISISEYCFMMGSFRTLTKYDSYFQNEMLVNLIPLQQSVPHHRSYYYDNYMMRKPCHPSSRLFPLGKVRPQLVILICYCCIKIEQRNFNTIQNCPSFSFRERSNTYVGMFKVYACSISTGFETFIEGFITW